MIVASLLTAAVAGLGLAQAANADDTPYGQLELSLSNVQATTSGATTTVSFDYAPNVDPAYWQSGDDNGVPDTAWLFVSVYQGDESVFGEAVFVGGAGSYRTQLTNLEPGTYDLVIDGAVLVKGGDTTGATIQYETSFVVASSSVQVVTPQAPNQNGNKVNIPAQTGVTYVDGDGTVLSGTVFFDEAGLTVTAIPNDGYTFTEGATTQWSYEYTPPVVEPIVAPAPTQEEDVVTIPVVSGVEYYDVTTDTVLTGEVSASPQIVIGARAAGEAPVEGGPWTFSYTPPVVVPTDAATSTDTQDVASTSSPAATSTSTLAATGSDGLTTASIGIGAGVLLLGGASLLLFVRRLRRTHTG